MTDCVGCDCPCILAQMAYWTAAVEADQDQIDAWQAEKTADEYQLNYWNMRGYACSCGSGFAAPSSGGPSLEELDQKRKSARKDADAKKEKARESAAKKAKALADLEALQNEDK